MSRGASFAASLATLPILAVPLIAALLILPGCQTSRTIRLRSELANPVGRITVHTKDRQTYRLPSYALVGSAIRGSGTVEKGFEKKPFLGEIPLDSILGIETTSIDVLRSLVAVGAAVVIIAAVTSEVNGPNNGLATRVDVQHYGPTSCPYVYAWNGERYVLEAEPFGVALGKALELTTFHLLPSVLPEDGIVRLRLTNERQETHYINSIQVFAIDAGEAPGVVLDGSGTAWPVGDPTPPARAGERSGRDILKDVASADGRMWECDASSLSPGSGYEDIVDLAFPRPPGARTRSSDARTGSSDARTGSLILTGINTTLSTTMFGYCSRIAGDQAIELTHAIDTDPELIARLHAYLDDASLKVSVWDGRAWEAQGAFRPEANAVTFTRGLRIRVPEGAGDTVRVRLRSMADVWKIDAISADWTAASPLPMRPVEVLSAIGPGGVDMGPLLRADDDRYAILLPPDRVELTVAAAKAAPGGKIAYAVAGRGYLHEWAPEPAGEGADGAGVASLAAMVPADRRIDLLKELLRHRDIVLQSVYEERGRQAHP